MRSPDTETWWKAEVDWIEAQAQRPGPQFMGSFEAYCKMQERFARRDGFITLADRIKAVMKE